MEIKTRYICIVLIILAMILSACTSSAAGTNDSGNSSAEDSSTSIVIGLAAEPTTLMASTDPAASTSGIIRNIYSQLIDYDGKGNFIPKLATEWKNIDEYTWEFKLREGVTFHNGAPFNAESVKFTIDYMLNPDNKSVYGSRWMKELKEFKVVDEYTIQFVTQQPNASFLHRVFTDIQPLEPGYVQEVGIEEAAKKPIGVGAYKFKEWKRGESVTFEANDDYWEGEPQIKDVTIKFIPEFSSRLSSLLSGDVDLIKSVPVDSIERVEGDGELKIISGLTGKPAFIAFNTFKDSPLKDVKVRQALNYAIDVDSLIKNVMNDRAEKLTGTLTPFNASFVEVDEYEYNPEKAKQLIAEAGYKVEDLELTLETTNGYFPMDSQIVQAIAGELEKLGMKITVIQNETGVYVQKATSQKMDDMYFYTAAASTEGESMYSFYYSPTGVYRFHNNPELLGEIASTFPIFDPTERQQAMKDIQVKLMEEAVIIPLWIGEDLWGAKKDISFKPKFNEALDIYSIERGQ
jgi:peptide/nickel transport system substrate-binding protein